MRKVEILAPAGSYESMKAAVNASCDAIYIGGSQFGARAFANNLEEENMLNTIDYLHLHGKKIYMTVNTLLKEDEINEKLYHYLKPYYEAGLDAAIVQDVGVAKFVHENFPDMAIHASTQMTLTSAYGTKILENYGITRFVPARELSIHEITEMRAHTDLEIECFVHGALCYCYSGQCLLSSIIGGRSGNRGRCAQPCRMQYELKTSGKTGYFLSPKDISTIASIPNMIEAGINSFKIEGRMKRPEYTALCSYLYGKYTDLYLDKGKEGYERYLKDNMMEFTKDQMALADIYNRGNFSTGYYTNYHGKTMMSMKRPNHYGVLVGEVKEVNGNKATIKLSEDVNKQDVLEFRDIEEQEIYDYTAGQASLANDTIEANFKHGLKIRKGNRIYRTKNQKLLDWLQQEFLSMDKKIGIEGLFHCKSGEPFAITLIFEDKEVTVTGEIVQKAQNQPVTENKISEAISKISDTKYYFTKLSGEVSLDAFLPMGAVKNLRRNALEALEEKILDEYKRTLSDKTVVLHESKSRLKCDENLNETVKPSIHVLVNSKQQFEEALKISQVSRIYIVSEQFSVENCEACIKEGKEKGTEIYLSLPYIFRSNTMKAYSEYTTLDVDGYLIHNFEEVAFLKQQGVNQNFVLDSNMYTFNSFAKSFWKDQQVNSYTIPVELNEREIKQRGIENDTLIVYGHLPLMISTQCIVDNCLTCNKKPDFHILYDRKGKDYYAFNCCKYCYNIIYDGEALSLLEEIKSVKNMNPDNVRLDFTIETDKEMQFILKNFIDVFRYNKGSEIIPNTTKGHFKRGIE